MYVGEVRILRILYNTHHHNRVAAWHTATTRGSQSQPLRVVRSLLPFPSPFPHSSTQQRCHDVCLGLLGARSLQALSFLNRKSGQASRKKMWTPLYFGRPEKSPVILLTLCAWSSGKDNHTGTHARTHTIYNKYKYIHTTLHCMLSYSRSHQVPQGIWPLRWANLYALDPGSPGLRGQACVCV